MVFTKHVSEEPPFPRFCKFFFSRIIEKDFLALYRHCYRFGKHISLGLFAYTCFLTKWNEEYRTFLAGSCRGSFGLLLSWHSFVAFLVPPLVSRLLHIVRVYIIKKIAELHCFIPITMTGVAAAAARTVVQAETLQWQQSNHLFLLLLRLPPFNPQRWP